MLDGVPHGCRAAEKLALTDAERGLLGDPLDGSVVLLLL